MPNQCHHTSHIWNPGDKQRLRACCLIKNRQKVFTIHRHLRLHFLFAHLWRYLLSYEGSFLPSKNKYESIWTCLSSVSSTSNWTSLARYFPPSFLRSRPESQLPRLRSEVAGQMGDQGRQDIRKRGLQNRLSSTGTISLQTSPNTFHSGHSQLVQ